MTNSEKQTKSPAGTSSAPAAYASDSFWGQVVVNRQSLVAGCVLLVMGWGFALHVNNWHFTVPVFMLWMAWLGALVTVRLLWSMGLAVASEATDAKGTQVLDVREPRRIELLEEKKSLIRAIKEIEFDRDLGKMSDEDAAEMMRFYRARAVEVIKELAGSDDGTLTVEERVERDLKARLTVEGAVRRGKTAAAKVADKAKGAASAKAAADDGEQASAAPVPAKSAADAASEDSKDTSAKESSKSSTTSASEEPTEAPLESA